MMATARQSVETHRTLLRRLEDARRRTDALFGIVKPEHLYDRPIPERHRIVFYIGHLEAFDWNLLREPIGNPASSQPEFDRLFAFGIDPVGGGLPSDQPSDWPAIQIVRDYNASVRETLDAGLAKASGICDPGPLGQLLNVAIEHRLMHEETLSYMLHQLPFEKKSPRPQEPANQPAAARPLETAMVEIPAGTATLGLDRESGAFGWDNEYEAHERNVPAFSIDRCMVTNGQFMKFLEAGGYEDRSLWSGEAWKWRAETGVQHPVFWKRDDGRWLWRGMFDEFPLPLDWPVYVSHAEASAYARWAGKALPSEAQWHRAAYGTPEGKHRLFPWGNEAASARSGNFDFRRWDPVAVDAFPENESGFGVRGMLGNGWEWTASVFAPFRGFRKFPFYPGYSANFFDGKHYTMKGGSPRTAAAMLRSSFRNWFQPHYPYVYAGFRCVSA